jgi:hypothetical protein
MKKTWFWNSKDRPTFTDIVVFIEEILPNLPSTQ